LGLKFGAFTIWKEFSFFSKIAVIETPYFIKREKSLTATQVLWDRAPGCAASCIAAIAHRFKRRVNLAECGCQEAQRWRVRLPDLRR
jgi:hypothetical protein